MLPPQDQRAGQDRQDDQRQTHENCGIQIVGRAGGQHGGQDPEEGQCQGAETDEDRGEDGEVFHSVAPWTVRNLLTGGIYGTATSYAAALRIWEIVGRPSDVAFES